MDAEVPDEDRVLRIPVEAPWFLWNEIEFQIDGWIVTLRDPTSQLEMRLSRFDFVARDGRVLHFRSQARPIGAHCIEFAGLGRDAEYTVTFPDETAAKIAAARLERHFARKP